MNLLLIFLAQTEETNETQEQSEDEEDEGKISLITYKHAFCSNLIQSIAIITL